MLQQVEDLRAEGADLYAFLDGLAPADWDRPTPFKGWTPNDVVQHLHMGDWMAVLSMTDEAAFLALLEKRKAVREGAAPGQGVGPDMQTGAALREQWYGYFRQLCGLLDARDPKDRVLWVGPSMSVRMCATARQMETWAHAQDIYDLLRAPREHFDRLRNIAEIGVRTYGWTFANRGEEPGAHRSLCAPDRPQRCDLGMGRAERDRQGGGLGPGILPGGDPGPEHRRREPDGGGRAGTAVDGDCPMLRRPAPQPARQGGARLVVTPAEVGGAGALPALHPVSRISIPFHPE